jgi:hypothetical protein
MVEEDDEPIQERLRRLNEELLIAFDEGNRLQTKICAALEQIDG